MSWDTYWETVESRDFVNYTPHIVEMLAKHVHLPDCQVLEVGVGTGGNSTALASLGAQVTALDLSLPALARAFLTVSQAGAAVRLVQADAFRLPFPDGAFSVVFHQGLLEHFVDPAAVVREQKRVLRSGGYLLVDVPQKYNLYTWHKRNLIRAGNWPYGGWEREFSLLELRRLLEMHGFRIVGSYGRGYYPRPFHIVRNLRKVETKVLHRAFMPRRIWAGYDSFWRWFESSVVGCNLLQCLGVLGQVIES